MFGVDDVGCRVELGPGRGGAAPTRTVTQIPIEATEAAFRTLLTDNPSGVEASTYCVAVVRINLERDRQDYSDPPLAVVQSLALMHPSLQPYSKCRLHQARGISRLLDRVTGEQAMVLAVREPSRSVGDTIVFWGSYHCGALCGGAGPLRVWRQDGTWHTRFTVEWVS